MKKIILGFIYTITISVLLFLTYFSIFGFETNKFNNQIQKKIQETDQELSINLNKVKLILDPFKFQINAKTLGAILVHKDKNIDFEVIKTKISLKSLLNDEFSLSNLNASTKSLEVKNLISFIQSLNRNTELFILEKFIKKGYLIADINLNFDESGNLKKDFKINGFVKDTKIDIFKKFKIDNLNFIFDIDKENLKLQDIKLSFNSLKFVSNNLNVKKTKNEYKILGSIENQDLIIDNQKINLLFNSYFKNYEIQKIRFSSKNNFSFKLNKKFRFKDLEIKSKIDLKELTVLNNLKLKKIFPQMNKTISFTDQKLEINFKKDNINIKGSGNLLLQENKDKINFLINKKGSVYNFDTSLEINDNPFNIAFLNYEKNQNNSAIFKLKGKKELEKTTKFDLISFVEKNNIIKIQNLILDKRFKLINLDGALIDILDKNQNFNKFKIIKKSKNNYYLNGSNFNADNLIESLLSNDDHSLNILSKNFKIFINIDKVLLDNNYNLNNLKGDFTVQNQKIKNGSLIGSFSDNKKLKFTVQSKGQKKITTLFSDKAEAIVSRYKFIKGFKGGVLDFYSSKQNDVSVSKLKIYDFKLKELPALTKLLTLASLQGIADLVSGDGIGFDEFEMSFKNQKNVMTINEIYAIGPAISILMDGYVEKNKLISLRGTLVPATTINKFIGSIPILGEILVGSKTGEGVFGVSFKIKGPPKNLETTVNPIKTLTPRFITRTLEKIKKN